MGPDGAAHRGDAAIKVGGVEGRLAGLLGEFQRQERQAPVARRALGLKGGVRVVVGMGAPVTALVTTLLTALVTTLVITLVITLVTTLVTTWRAVLDILPVFLLLGAQTVDADFARKRAPAPGGAVGRHLRARCRPCICCGGRDGRIMRFHGAHHTAGATPCGNVSHTLYSQRAKMVDLQRVRLTS